MLTGPTDTARILHKQIQIEPCSQEKAWKQTELTHKEVSALRLSPRLNRVYSTIVNSWGEVVYRCIFVAGSLIAGMTVIGCSKKADSIAATYVSPITYENYTCPQLAEEMQRISTRAAQAAGVQDSKATKDTVAMTVGLVVFWPSLLLLSGGNGENAAELARLKGSLEALEQVGVRKNCGIQIQRPEPPRRPRRAHRMEGETG